MSDQHEARSLDTPPFCLTVADLKTWYQADHNLVRAVDGVSFAIQGEQKVGIAGESGSGKTQTALSIMGLTSGQPGIIGGEIRVNDVDLLRDFQFAPVEGRKAGKSRGRGVWRAARKKHQQLMQTVRGKTMTMVFQEPKSSLSPYFTVQDQLFETFLLHRPGTGEALFIAEMESLLGELGFAEPLRIMKSYPHQLSGGESQRIMIALSLVSRPQLFIADEPTTALDAVTQYRVIEHLERTITSRKIALLFITHNLALLNYLVDHIIVMFSGKIVEMGPRGDVISIRKNAHHPYTELLLRSVRFWNESDPVSSVAQNAALEQKRNHQGCRYYHRCGVKESLSRQEKQRCLYDEPMLESVAAGDDSLKIACWQRGRHE